MATPPDTEVDLPQTEHDARPVEARAAIPSKLNDRYEVGALLGEGGMGEVRECQDLVMGRAVALKMIRRDRHALHLEGRFVREACVQAQLEHPCVVPVFDVARVADGSPFFTMRKVNGVTLDEILRRLQAGDRATIDAFTRHRLLAAFTQACLTIDYAHTRGVLHRDLKPGNIMFGDFGEIYVLDWGVAKLTLAERSPSSGVGPPREAKGERTQVGSAVGTPAYMAPEQLAGRELDARADVFALGAVLFEILTLEPLFDERAVPMRADGGRTRPDARPTVRAPQLQVPPEFDGICVRATAELVERRYPSARALHDVIDAYLGGERDVELRKQLATEHFARAEAAGSPDLTLRELQRAFALAPEDPRGLELLVELLKATPATSEEARGHVVSEGIERLRRAQPLGALLFAAPWLTIYPWLCTLRGVSDGWIAVAPPLAWAVAVITILVDHRQGSQDRVRYPTFAIMFALGLTSLLLGPLFVVPAAAVSVVTSHVLVSARSLRNTAIVLGCLAVVVPTLLAWHGDHDVYRSVSETTFTVAGVFNSLRPARLGVGLTAVDLMMLLSVALFAGRFRDEVERARTENVLFAWQLSKLLPVAASEAALSTASDPRQPAARAAETSLRIVDIEIETNAEGPRANDETFISTPGGDDEHGAFGLPVDGARYEPIAPVVVDGSVEATPCLDRLVGREVVMKRLPVGLAAHTDGEPAFMREALLQARLDHPGIPPVYDRGSDARGPWFTTQRVLGTTLAELLATERPGEHRRHRRLMAFAQVCLTVDFAHAHGIVHAALEPSRIVLGEFGEVYVLGWGSSATRTYAAPEQAAGGRVDARADVFALGAILFEVLTGKPLFGGTEPFSLVLGWYDARPSARAHAEAISPLLDAICAKATAYDPADRYATARELHNAVEASMGHDRDELLRRTLGEERLGRATRSAERAISSSDERARIKALRELGSALALLPDRAPARRLFERLLASPPSPLPLEVAREIAVQTRSVPRRAVPAAAKVLAFVSLVAFPLVAVLAGVRDPLAATAVSLTWAIAAATAYVEHAVVRAPFRLPWTGISAFVAVEATSLLFGPYILGPAGAIALTMAYVLGGRLEWRRGAIALGCVAIVIPAVLTWIGVLDACELAATPTQTVTVILRGAIYHPRDVLLGGLLVANFLVVLLAAVYGARVRDAFAEIEAVNRAKVLGLSRLLS